MSRRQYDIRFPCAEQGCREQYWSVAATRQEERETRTYYAQHPWRCSRHRKPDEVLSVDNRERETVLVAGKSKRFPDLPDLYWGNGSGLESGPGFKAWATDFPPGTRLIITARIELPANSPSPQADLAPCGEDAPSALSRDTATAEGVPKLPAEAGGIGE